MFRNVARVLRSTRSLSTGVRATASRPCRNLAFGASWTSTNIPKIDVQRVCRRYSATAGEGQASGFSPGPEDKLEDLPWLQLLESTANAPWLTLTPPDHLDKLRRAYSLLFQVILYLGRPLPKDSQDAVIAAQQFLLAFNSAPASDESEIARARYSIGLLTKTVVDNISTIPQSAPIRTQHVQIFALADALVPLCEVHLGGLVQGTAPTTGEVVEAGKWQDFWSKAQPIVLALAEELDKEGYGIDEELMKEAIAEQEKKDSEATAAPENKN